ncbi:protein phosphatase 2C domain-containing protein, partial [Pseudonocardia zijingensis]|uniref:protein phosphatase 2C domain-containing protein n=1 Tax=Pseudonocardia zijingensis TaxID=153376 RepID=UPI0031D137D1
LSVVNSAQPAGTGLTRERLAERVARALGLSERAADRMLRRAARLDPALVGAPGGITATGVGLDQAIALVTTRLAEAFPQLRDARAAHTAAGRALRAGTTDAVRIATDAGVAAPRAVRRIHRATRGRGVAGLRARAWTRLGLDVPVPDRIRTRGVARAGIGIGLGVGLVIGALPGAAVAAAVPIGVVVAVGGVLAAVRALWTPRQTRGPPGRALLRGLRAHGVRLGLWAAGAGGAVIGAPPMWDQLERLWPVFVHQPGLLGVKALLVPLATAGLVFRYVLRRQYVNQRSGMQTRPRQAAWASAVAAYTFTAALGLARAFGLVTGYVGLWPVAAAVVVGITSSILQKKDTKRTRVIKAGVSGTLSAAVAHLVSTFGTALAPGSWGDLFNTVVVATFVYAAPTVVAEYVNVAIGRIMAPRVKRKAQETTKGGAAKGERQRRLYRAWLDYKSFSPVDNRLLLHKALDPILAGLSAIVINLAWAARPWVLANDNSLMTVLLRFAVAATAVWLIGKLLRDPVEHRTGYYGFRSPRTPRSPSRPGLWTVLTGGRIHHRARGYRQDLDRVLGRYRLSGRELDRGLAEELAALLWGRMQAEIHEPLPEWEPLPRDADLVDALAAERRHTQQRRAQHVRAVELVVPVLAADPAALQRVADRLRGARPADARVLDFQRMLSQELWALFEEAWTDRAETPAHRVWAARLAAALAERVELREQYLAGPRRELLELIKQHHLDAGERSAPNLRRARTELRALEFELRASSKPRPEPLEAVAQLADQRARSVAAAAAAEEQGIVDRDPSASIGRLAEMRQLEAAMRLLRAGALLGVEAEHDRAQRSWNRNRWREAMARAVTQPPNRMPATLLERLLLLLGHRGPATPAGLAARFGGTGWAESLVALARLGALKEDEDGGYRATDALAALWRAAGPRLRHAVRSDAAVLPGGAELAALAVVDAAGTQAERDAVAALHDLLRAGDLAFRSERDGWIDDARLTWRRLAGLGYRLQHSAGRLRWPGPADHPAAPIRFAGAARDLVVTRWRHRVEPGTQRRLLERHLRAADAGGRLYFRALRAGEFLADQRPGRSMAPEAADLLHAARAVEVEAYAQLAEARGRAAEALDAVGSYRHQVDRTLRAATEARPHAPDSDPLPPTAEYWLREIARELDAVRSRLGRLHPGPERQAALADARLALERYAVDREYAWSTDLHRTSGGWRVMEAARVAAKRLRTAHESELFPAPAPPAPSRSSVIPHPDRVEQPDGDDDTAGPGMAASTRRGRGNRTNQDAATLVTLPNGDRVALVVDGVFSYPGSRSAAHRFTAAFRAELARGDRPGRTAAQLLLDAHQAGLFGLSAHHTPETGHAAVTYLAAHVAADGTTTTSHVGTARAYHLPLDRAAHGDGEQLTVDDTRGGDITGGGIMTRWAASDYRPEPRITTRPAGVPGLLVLATDGLWRDLAKPADLAGALPAAAYADPALAATHLAAAARRVVGRDDLTVAVLQAPVAGAIGPGAAPTGTAGVPWRRPR